ncbi:tumor necrosis factor receptor superfamily member 14-like [Macrotis lagotis]|uniref:tumor necrosis factor receptor superfamily member 14-like n=1 Tax=Macrotis lagotis TaxID=92651 RepID=UPI003D68DD55
MGIRSYLKVRIQVFRIVMILQSIPFEETVECMKGQYEVNGLCCFPCDTELGFMTKWECTHTSNTTCGCSPNYFCAYMKDDDCKKCEPLCHPGQYVKSLGTDRNDTICEKCLEGTFSPKGNLDQCLPWTKIFTSSLSETGPVLFSRLECFILERSVTTITLMGKSPKCL